MLTQERPSEGLQIDVEPLAEPTDDTLSPLPLELPMNACEGWSAADESIFAPPSDFFGPQKAKW